MDDERRQVTKENYREIAEWCDASVLFNPKDEPYLMLRRAVPFHRAEMGDFIIKNFYGTVPFQVAKAKDVLRG